MIEVLKQAMEAFEDISSWYDYEQSVGELASSMYEASCLAKSKANELRQAIAELERQDHIEQRLEMVKQKHKNNIWVKQLSAAQRNELSQIEDGTWEADRNG